ncbi:MAG: ABC transporter ATP-binding protein, partial [Hungatella sp.]
MAKTSFRPVEKPDQIRSYWKRQVPILALVTLFGITFDGLTPYMTVLQGRLIDALVFGEMLPGVQRSAAIFVGTVLVVQLARYGKRYYVRLFANRTMMDMRMMLYNNIMHRDILTLSKESTGDLMVKAVSDVDICVEGMRKVTTEIFDTGVLAISYLTAMLFYDVKITVLCCIFVPLAMLLAEYLKSTIVRLSKAARAQSSRVAERTYRDID